ncbi:1376_t:CDS:10 [Funneliformis geosporum]|uniref:5458_t:CDS:1 n=1 Tax=Funneliformis geosporum TaxID=1117311 RepID=A0A9W4WN44_9GLOM|nr:1376_t:CDS:10 [Funneliformis geosporum]CAI2166313.1 5458_t:CDS:10 [Funneliformis geosporum]
MTNLTKANQREKELDAARCKVLQQTALAEYDLVQAIQKTELEQNFSQSNYDNDSPENITLQPNVDEVLVKSVYEKINVALAEAQGQEKEYTSIILARAHFAVGRYDKCVETLSTDFVPSELPTGYNFVLVVQGLTLKGMAHEALSDFVGAIACYDQVVILLSQNINEKHDQLWDWSEEALYHAPLLKLRLGDTSGALQAFRTYQLYTTLWGDKFRIKKRAIVYKYFIKLLSRIYQEGTYVPPSATSLDTSEQSTVYTPHTFRIELTELHSLYENILYQITTFPKAGEINSRMLEMVDQVMSDWAVLGGGTAAEMRGLIEMLHRVTHKTFQSPRILRHLINTLIIYGDYEEAELALNAYIALVERAKKTKIEDIEKQMHYSLTEHENGVSHDLKLNSYVEPSEQVILILISGSDLMAKYMNKAHSTLEIAQKAVNWYENDNSLDDDDLLARAWRCVGVGYSLLATEETDPGKRPELHSKAIEALKISISLDSEAFETHYQLSLEYAMTRDINQAIISVRQALTLDSSMSCWHLLVLLFSSQKDIQGALKACEVAIKESDWDTADPTVDYSTLSVIGNDDGNEFLSFKLTQNALQELSSGTEVAIQNFDKLFMLYGKVFPDYNIITSPNGSIYDATSLTITAATVKPPVGNNSVKSFTSTDKKEGYISTEGSIYSVGHKDTLDVPKTNYAPSIASSRNSASSGLRRSPTSTIVGAAKLVNQSTTPALQVTTLKTRQRRQRAAKALTDLWLSSASTFRRLGNFEEAQKTIENAEEVDNSSPDVWCQFGLLLLAQGSYTDAITSFHKALAIDDKHVPSLVHLARTYMETNDLEIAEGLLDGVAKSNGWNCAEAWLYLGKVCQATNRIKRAKKCLWFAFDLEETKPIRPFNVLPRNMEKIEMGGRGAKRGAFVTYHRRIDSVEYFYTYDSKEIKIYSAITDNFIRTFSIKEYNIINKLIGDNEIKEIVYITDCFLDNASLLVCSRTKKNLYHCFICDIVNSEYQPLPINLDSMIPSINDVVVSEKIETNDETQSIYVFIFASVIGLSIYWLTYNPYNQHNFNFIRDLNVKLFTRDSITAVNTYNNNLNGGLDDKRAFYIIAGGVQGNIECFEIMNDGSDYKPHQIPLLRLIGTSDPVPPVTHIVIRNLSDLKERLIFIGYGKLNSRIFNRSPLARLERVPIVQIARVSFNHTELDWNEIDVVFGNPGADVTRGEIISMFVTSDDTGHNLYVALDMYYRPNKYRSLDGIEVTHYKVENLNRVTMTWHRVDSLCRKSSNLNEIPLLDIYADQNNRGLKLLLPNEVEWYQISPLPKDESDDDDGTPSFERWFDLEFNQIGPYNIESFKDIETRREKYENELMLDILLESQKLDKLLYPPDSKYDLKRLFEEIFKNNEDDLVWKYGIMYYLLRDWSFIPKLSQKFIARYLTSSQDMQIFVDGCWELDHERFDEAVRCLSDPIVKNLLSEFPRIDEKIMKLFLISSCPDHALKYSHFRCIVKKSTEIMELYIEALIRNSIINTSEALKFARQNKSDDDENVNRRLLIKILDICVVEDKTETQVYEKELLSLELDDYEEKFILKYWEDSKEPKLLWFYIKELVKNENYRESLINFRVYKWFKETCLNMQLTNDEIQLGVNMEAKKNEDDSDDEELDDDIKEKLNHYKRLFIGIQSFSDQMGIDLESDKSKYKSQDEAKKRKLQEKEKFYEQHGVKRDKVEPLLKNRSPLSASN